MSSSVNAKAKASFMEKTRDFVTKVARRPTGYKQPKPQHWEKDKKPDDPTVFESEGDPLIIAVIGAAGVGKSTYINGLLGAPKMATSHHLEACTKHPEHATIPLSATPLGTWDKYHGHGEREIVLLDTPGFNDIDIPDTEILRRIALWLAASYAKQITIAGVVFLHNIRDNRITPLGKQNIELFQGLVGVPALSRVMIGQTNWEGLPHEALKARSDDLRQKYYKPLLDCHASLVRVNGPGEGHGKTKGKIRVDLWTQLDLIIDEALLNPSPTLRIQEELVDLNKRLQETKASRAIHLDDIIAKLKQDIDAEKQKLAPGVTESETLNGLKVRFQEVMEELEKRKVVSLPMRLRSFFGLLS